MKPEKYLLDEAGITTIPPLDCREQEPGVMRTDDYMTYFMNEEGTNKLMIKINWVEKKIKLSGTERGNSI